MPTKPGSRTGVGTGVGPGVEAGSPFTVTLSTRNVPVLATVVPVEPKPNRRKTVVLARLFSAKDTGAKVAEGSGLLVPNTAPRLLRSSTVSGPVLERRASKVIEVRTLAPGVNHKRRLKECGDRCFLAHIAV
jgi:hypothetical protein